MTPTLRSLLAATTAAAALLAAPAARADHERGQLPGPDWRASPPPPSYAPPPLAHPVPAPLPPEPRWERPAHRGAWLRLRAEFRRLEETRADFYATWHGNPWRRARFERWYAVRRAELDRRRDWLASRGGRGDWYAQHDRFDD